MQTGVVAYNPDCRQDPYSNQITGTSCLAILYDTSGFKAPNTSDKDLHGININRLGRSCAFSLNGVCFGKIFMSESITMAECAELKNDLGISKCNTRDKDYWGGVVKACGGKQYVPSKTQMIEVAKPIEVTRLSKEDLKKGTVLNTNASVTTLQKECRKICGKNRKRRQRALEKY